MHAIMPTTIGNYTSWISQKQKEQHVKARDLRSDIEPIPGTDGSIMWVGDRDKATKFVIFYHGGGFLAPITYGHLEWCWQSYVVDGPGEKNDVAVAALQYTLCPVARYPEQLRQACGVLRFLLQRGIRPADIIIGGDSAGGTLIAEVLQHLIQPHPAIEPIQLREPFAAAFMVSPLLDGRVDSASYRDNEAVDMVSPELILTVSEEMFRSTSSMSAKEMRAMAFSMEGDLAWTSQLESVTKSLYITAGRQEVFRDAIVAFAENVRQQCPGLDLTFEAANEVHDGILLEFMLNQRPLNGATERMHTWASDKL